ncbi:hypothetical protein [Sporosarcina sp. FSL W7-1283]|uniref:hypothetical protein n=1 Tax=Sporosarcina sp. FSL W7-1283 TaxID=2921560 RepID=UPI0030F8D862
MQDHTITISAGSLQERNMRVRELLSRGYMPIKFFERQTEYVGVTEGRYVDKDGKQQRVKSTAITSRFCVVMRKRGVHREHKRAYAEEAATS